NFHDLPYARRVAEWFGCRHEEVTVTADECKQYLPQLAWQQDEPIGDPACLPMHFVCRAATRQGVTVVLVGEGSGEVFGGYPDFAHLLETYAGRWQRLRRLPRLARLAIHQAGRLGLASDGRLDVLRRAAHDEPLYWGLDVVFWDTEKEHLLQPRARAKMRPSSSSVVSQCYDEILRRRPKADFLQQMSHVELSNRLPELLLMRVDKFSMAHSLEARAPFLDHQLVSYVLSLPQRSKIMETGSKLVLRRAVADLLPTDALSRPKQGLPVSESRWP